MNITFTLSEPNENGVKDVDIEYPEGTTGLDMMSVAEELIFGLACNGLPRVGLHQLIDAIFDAVESTDEADNIQK